MAKLKETEEIIEKVIFVKEKTINLTLSIQELRALSVVLRKVGGSPSNTARKYIRDILDAIKDYVDCKYISDYIAEGSISFLPNSLKALG